MRITREMADRSPFLASLRKARNTKNKHLVINQMLVDRKIPCRVEYRWNFQRKPGWYICEGPMKGQRIGKDFWSACEMVQGKALVFLTTEAK